jgi:hypothetical protein
MPEVVIVPPVGHRRKKRGIGDRVQHPFHVDMIERLVSELGSRGRGDELLFD